VLECVINVSEGRNHAIIDSLAQSCAGDLLDIHSDPDHNRSVFTMVGVEAPRALARAAVSALRINDHSGVHPRLGVVDVVPFVPLVNSTMHDAQKARDEFALKKQIVSNSLKDLVRCLVKDDLFEIVIYFK
jgi:glutamate formiminotransferase